MSRNATQNLKTRAALSQLQIFPGRALRAVEDSEDKPRLVQLLPAAADAFGFDLVFRLTQTGSIKEIQPREEVNKPFEKENELRSVQERLTKINAELDMKPKEEPKKMIKKEELKKCL